VTVHSHTITLGFGNEAIKQKDRTLAPMVQLKSSIVQVGAEENISANTLIIAIASSKKDPSYTAYRKGRKTRTVVRQLIENTGIDLKNCAGIPELTRYQEYFQEYKIVLYSGLNCESIMYREHVESNKRNRLLFEEVTHHYHVICHLTEAMANRHDCEGSNKGFKYVVVHICEHTCSDSMVRLPCISAGIRIPCDQSNTHFRSQTCFDKLKRKRLGKRKSTCELRKRCGTCGATNCSVSHVKRTKRPVFFGLCVKW
jgi:hypothetical protein